MKHKREKSVSGVAVPLGFLVLLGACATPGPDGIADPYEPMNRRVHAFNRSLDAAVLRPLSRASQAGDAGTGDEDSALALLGRVGDNLSLPGKVVNHLLQGRPADAVQNAARFAVNTTLGLGGIHDPAGRDFSLPEVDTDFGETLHVWGVPEGAYLEIPVLGPSTERDFAGRIVDWVIDPVGDWLNPDQRRGARVVRLVSKAGDRAALGATVDSILHESADSYSQLRLIYLQNRRFELGEEADEIDPYADIDPYAE